ncbi:mRNA-capping enzyme subunit beta [Podila epicladia]|nr:mRNA-capping enzyme subunit beta [Podila epicladia]
MSDADSSRKRPLEEDNDPEADQDSTLNDKKSLAKKARPEEISGTLSGSQLGGANPPQPSSSSQAAPQPQQPPRPQAQAQQPPVPPPRRDHAFFGTDVMDDVVRAIEAKLGILTDNNTGRRIELPVMSETVIMPQRPAWYRFVSDMTIDQHAHFNSLLNNRLGETRQKDFRGYQIQYKHTKEIDQFYTGPQGKTRVTKDQSTNAVIPDGIVKKDRIADLDVFSPRSPFDFRVSVNVEVPVPAPTGNPQFERHKDRISYRHHNFKIDLTQVKTANSPTNSNQRPNYSQMARPTQQPDVTHELEIEFVHPEELVRERTIRLSGQGRPDRFWEIVGYFINNVRGLATTKYIPHAQRQQHQQHQQQQQQQRR